MFRLFLVLGSFIALATFCSNGSNPSRPTSTTIPKRTFEQWKEVAQEIPYEELFRYAEKHTGDIVYYRGQVLQVLEKQGDYQLRVLITPTDWGGWDDPVLVRYRDAPVRVLEEDIIAFVGKMNGTVSYKAIMGNEVTIPNITAYSLKIEDE